MSAFVCLLCERAGRETLAPRAGQQAICEDCLAWLVASGRAWCNRGRHAVPASELRPARSLCRGCDNARRKARYDANAEQERAAMRAYYQANRERRRQVIRAWQLRNPQRQTAYKTAWRRRNPERAKAIQLGYRARHRARVLAGQARYRVRRKLRILRGVA